MKEKELGGKKAISPVRMNITLSKEMYQKLGDYSVRWGVSKTNLISIILGQYFDNIEQAYSVIDNLKSDLSRAFLDELQVEMDQEN